MLVRVAVEVAVALAVRLHEPTCEDVPVAVAEKKIVAVWPPVLVHEPVPKIVVV